MRMSSVVWPIFTTLFSAFRDRHQQLAGPQLKAVDPCGMCGSSDGELLAKADYWDLQSVQLVKCSTCGTSRVDPRLTPKSVEIGCTALYRLQHSNETRASRRKGFRRAFRKGVSFATELKFKGVHLARVLEVGSGDGYFLKGVQHVFSEAKYSCLDIVKEILDATETVHGFTSHHSSVESFRTKPDQKFDLIIARDIIEHVNEPGSALRSLSEALSKNGRLYLITPNGLQDSWQLFSRWEKEKISGELLINHVNYFDPVSLRSFLTGLNLRIEDFYIYGFKQFFRGAGWRPIETHMARPSTRQSATGMIQSTPSLEVTFKDSIDGDVLPAVYQNKILKPVLMFYCWIKHSPKFRIGPEAKVGEEISILAARQ